MRKKRRRKKKKGERISPDSKITREYEQRAFLYRLDQKLKEEAKVTVEQRFLKRAKLALVALLLGFIQFFNENR